MILAFASGATSPHAMAPRPGSARFAIAGRDLFPGPPCRKRRCRRAVAARLTVTGGAVLLAVWPLAAQALAGAAALRIVDKASQKEMAGRVHLKDSTGQAVRPPGLPFHFDHFVCAGAASLALAPGRYTYEIERGPEFATASGTLEVGGSNGAPLTVELERLVDLAAEGWWAGDLHVHRPLEHVELLMRAEDLHVAPVITWWNNQNLWAERPVPAPLLRKFDANRFYHLMGGEDEREGGALLYFNLPEPLRIAGAGREHPSPIKFLAQARQHASAWVDIEKPFWWDVPVWLASGQVDSVGLANNHMCRDRMYETEAWGKPRDTARLPAPRGNGFWTQEIYYHLLNAGLRVPPSAGSASGVLPNPVGYNRVYVHVGEDLSYERWWEGLRAGRSFVSNGPLLRVRANGQLPGHVFAAPEGAELVLKLEAAITARDSFTAIELIQNGQVERRVPFDEWKQTGALGEVTFRESGWFLVRVIADQPTTFRFASTAPWHVEVGATKRRISRASARFFLDWVRERIGRVKVEDPVQREEVLQHHRAAERFWQERVAQANAP